MYRNVQLLVALIDINSKKECMMEKYLSYLFVGGLDGFLDGEVMLGSFTCP